MKPSIISKWPTILTLILIYVSVYFDWYWIWGIIFLAWSFMAIRHRETTLVQTIRRDEHAVLYWALVATWLLLSFYLLVFDALTLMGYSDA